MVSDQEIAEAPYGIAVRNLVTGLYFTEIRKSPAVNDFVPGCFVGQVVQVLEKVDSQHQHKIVGLIAYQYCCMISGTYSGNQKEIITTLNKIYIQKNYLCEKATHFQLPIDATLFDDINQVIKVGDGNKNKLRIAVSSIKLDEANFSDIVKGKPNRKYNRYQQISSLINTSIQQKADLLVMPEACVPIEWLATIARTCAKNNMAVITGVEHVLINKRVYNLTAVILPFTNDDFHCAHIVFHHKNHFAPDELRQIEGYGFEAMDTKGLHREVQYELFDWNNFWFPVYCCYELASISDRSIFQSYADAVFAVEWNHDVNYYSNILESLSRDLHCYCIQVNSCDYGDSRVTKPAKKQSLCLTSFLHGWKA